jgi:gluconate 2-dehydrogenase gamma chain
VSRRDLLAGGAATIACALVPASSLTFSRTNPGQAGTPQISTPKLEVLTATERQSLEAMVSRIIPAGSDGPGALEAGSARYIESALGEAYQSAKKAYTAGLAALDAYANSNYGKSFVVLGEAEQDGILSEFEKNVKVGEYTESSNFFEMVRRHTLEGMFGDPSYGGNANFAGWDLIGYPGPRMYVPPQMQALDTKPPRSRVSAKELVHGSH